MTDQIKLKPYINTDFRSNFRILEHGRKILNDEEYAKLLKAVTDAK
jgi:hypothetical protein